jgi:choline dehydrogenase-like flavoprotein
MIEQHYDAIVIGSGITGGWAAKELTEKGLKVLLLERGRNVEHIKDYTTTNMDPWDFPHRGRPTTVQKDRNPVLRRDYPLNELNPHFWVDDQDCPYTEIKRFDWYRGYHVGGRSLMWGRQSYRWNREDFLANEKDGIATPWPIGYDDMEPWYTYVEKHAGLSGSAEGLDVLPDSHFLHAMELNCVEKTAAERIKKHYDGKRRLIIGRTATIAVPHKGRTGCQYRDKCWLGCPYGGYFSTQSSTLPAAMATGNLTLRPFSIVKALLYDKNRKRVRGVEILDAETNLTYEFTSDIVFLNASALNSTWLLMQSATDVWEGGLGSSSGELGHNLMDHHFRVGASGDWEGDADKYYFGSRPTGFYIPRFRNWYGDKRDYLRGFGYQGAASRAGWERGVAELGIGADFKEAMSKPGPWQISMTAFGEVLPYHENKVSLDRSRTDKWGLPVLAIDAELKENELKMRVDMKQDAVEMFEAVGFKNVHGDETDYALGMGIHEMGTARMGTSPKNSVLNKWNQVWDAPNVFVTDGAAMTSASCVNPSLTYMAITARAADYAVKELKKRNL